MKESISLCPFCEKQPIVQNTACSHCGRSYAEIKEKVAASAKTSKLMFSAGQRFTMKDGVEYITSDRGEFLRLTPRVGKKSKRRAGEVK